MLSHHIIFQSVPLASLKKATASQPRPPMLRLRHLCSTIDRIIPGSFTAVSRQRRQPVRDAPLHLRQGRALGIRQPEAAAARAAPALAPRVVDAVAKHAKVGLRWWTCGGKQEAALTTVVGEELADGRRERRRGRCRVCSR